MPTTIINQDEAIINQDEAIINYISELNLPYSSELKNHMVNMVSGIVLTEGGKTISSIYNKLTCNHHKSSGSRFLGTYSWNHEYVNDRRIHHALDFISNRVNSQSIGFLVIDDTLSKKNVSTKHIQGLDFHNSHADGNKPMWSHCVVTSHYKVDKISLPLSFKQYQREKSMESKLKKHFKSKQELAIQLIDEFSPVTQTNYLLIDAWYTSAKVMIHALTKGYHAIESIKSNRVIYPAGIRVGLKDFTKHIRKSDTVPLTVGKQTYYVYRYEGKLNDLENSVVLISWSKKDLSDKPAFIISTDVSLTDSEVISYYENRWDIEVSYRYHKSTLGFAQYRVESIKSVKRYWSMIYLTYTFLEIQRIEKGKKMKFATLGDVIGYFRNKYLVQIINFSYNCAKDNIGLSTIFAKLGLVA